MRICHDLRNLLFFLFEYFFEIFALKKKFSPALANLSSPLVKIWFIEYTESKRIAKLHLSKNILIRSILTLLMPLDCVVGDDYET